MTTPNSTHRAADLADLTIGTFRVKSIGATSFTPAAGVEGVDICPQIDQQTGEIYGDGQQVVVSVTLGGTSGTISYGMVAITLDPEDEVETEAVD